MRFRLRHVLLFMAALLCGACGTQGISERSLGNTSVHDGGPGDTTTTTAIDPMCPASNLTRGCMCNDGGSGRQICIEQLGWQACDCGKGSKEGDAGINLGDTTPIANTNAAVNFDDFVMPEVVAPGDCKPGNYTGTFQCSYTGPLSSSPFEINGVVSFALSESSNAEVLVIENGLLDGWGFVFFFAYLNGDLNCATGDLAGTATEGFYSLVIKGCSGASTDVPGTNCAITDKNDPNYVPWTVNLEGTYSGVLDKATDTITGVWSMMPTDIGGSCDGAFTVTYTP